MKLKILRFSPICLVALLLSGCATLNIQTPSQRYETLERITKDNDLKIVPYCDTIIPVLSVAAKSLESCQTIKVFIEGDGLAWITKSKVSDDPTPINPLALKLMVKDTSQCKIYLARPCQYITNQHCNETIWTSNRFDQKTIDSYQIVLNMIRKINHNSSFELIGYSGGGAIATILSANRNDVVKLTTIAGNLDTTNWVKYHNIEPLSGSLNPADFTNKLEELSQIHYIGRNDKIIPNDITKSFVDRFGDKSNIKIKSCDQCTHGDGWIEFWDEKQ